MDYFEKIGYNLWLKNKCTWEAYLISRKVEKLIINKKNNRHTKRNNTVKK